MIKVNYRTLNRKDCKNPALARLGWHTRLLYLYLRLECDRDGRCLDDVDSLRVELFPFRYDDVLDLEAMLNELTIPYKDNPPLITRYRTSDGRKVIQYMDWENTQRPHCTERPSTVEPPTEEQVWAQRNSPDLPFAGIPSLKLPNISKPITTNTSRELTSCCSCSCSCSCSKQHVSKPKDASIVVAPAAPITWLLKLFGDMYLHYQRWVYSQENPKKSWEEVKLLKLPTYHSSFGRDGKQLKDLWGDYLKQHDGNEEATKVYMQDLMKLYFREMQKRYKKNMVPNPSILKFFSEQSSLNTRLVAAVAKTEGGNNGTNTGQ